MKQHYEEMGRKMEKTIDVMNADFAAIRAGRANPAVLDKITVDYYGTATPIQQIASVSVPEARTIIIQPWDVSAIVSIEKAIQKSDLGINPNNDGKVIRLNFPQLNEERRKELVKGVHKRAEEGKIALRAIRRDTIEQYKAKKKSSEITEDDLKNIEKDIQNLTDINCKEIDRFAMLKEKEIIEV